MSDLIQNQMSSSHTNRAHAQEVWDKSDKDKGWLSVGKESGNPPCYEWFTSKVTFEFFVFSEKYLFGIFLTILLFKLLGI